MGDITCLFLTINKVPKDWAAYHRDVMLDAVGSHPLITFSREKMDLPGKQFRQNDVQSHDKMYRLLLEGAKIATTDYIAIVEDDILYTKEHFDLRPPIDTFGYNWNRWSLFTWGEPTYSFKRRICGGVGIFPRLEMIDAYEERFAKWKEIPHYLNGELGYEKVEKNLGVKVRKSMELYSKTPVVQMHHTYGTPGYGKRVLNANDTVDLKERQTRKRMGMVRAHEIPHWGRSEELVKHFI